jgi:chromate reductase, NAD(P)H dehydrogenase (quinone)
MPKKLNIVSICGSLRKGSFNAALARALPALAPENMAITASPPWESFPVYNADVQNSTGFPAEVTALADVLRKADGIIFVSPEYNYSIPGGLKNAIDWLSRLKEQPFFQKPVALQSAAGGPLGASRMQYHMRQTMVFLDAYVFTRPEIFVTFAPQKFDEKTLELKDEPTRHIITQQLNGFSDFVRRITGKAFVGPD